MHAQDPEPGEITHALRASQTDETGAADRLFALVEPELRRRVARLRAGARPDPSSQTTAVVHDAFLRLSSERAQWQNRDHYLGVAAVTAQRLLHDLARHRSRRKRGGGAVNADLPEHLAGKHTDPDLLLDLQAALERLGGLRPRWRQLAELRILVGLDNQSIADALEVSLSTVEHDWVFIRAWLHRELA